MQAILHHSLTIIAFAEMASSPLHGPHLPGLCLVLDKDKETPPNLATLPTELLLNVFARVEASDLAALSRTSWSIHCLAQTLLYKSVCVYKLESNKKPLGSRVELLLRTVVQNGALADQIKTLIIEANAKQLCVKRSDFYDLGLMKYTAVSTTTVPR
jgi:hypothetical protein